MCRFRTKCAEARAFSCFWYTHCVGRTSNRFACLRKQTSSTFCRISTSFCAATLLFYLLLYQDSDFLLFLRALRVLRVLRVLGLSAPFLNRLRFPVCLIGSHEPVVAYDTSSLVYHSSTDQPLPASSSSAAALLTAIVVSPSFSFFFSDNSGFAIIHRLTFYHFWHLTPTASAFCSIAISTPSSTGYLSAARKVILCHFESNPSCFAANHLSPPPPPTGSSGFG